MLSFILSTVLLALGSLMLILMIYMVRSNVALPKGPYLWISDLYTFALFLLVPIGFVLAVNANSHYLASGIL